MLNTASGFKAASVSIADHDGDGDGDGDPDLIRRNTSNGANRFWETNGLSRADYGKLS